MADQREPGGAIRRPSDKMPARSALHDAHDLLLISAWVAGDATATEAARAEAIAGTCPECRTLAADLRVIAAETRRLPAPTRSRDFRISPQEAARLRGRWFWRRLVWSLADPRGLARPLSAALTTLGLAGLLLTAAPGLIGTGSGAFQQEDAQRSIGAPSSASGPAGPSGASAANASAAPRAADGVGPTPLTPASDASPDPGKAAAGQPTFGQTSPTRAPATDGPAAVAPQTSVPQAGVPAAGGLGGGAATEGPAGGSDFAGETARDRASPTGQQGTGATGFRDTNEGAAGQTSAGPPPLAVLSLGFLVAGIGLFILRRTAARLAG